MADLEDSKTSSGQEQQHSSGGRGGDIGLNMPYIKSIPGILKIVEFVCIYRLINCCCFSHQQIVRQAILIQTWVQLINHNVKSEKKMKKGMVISFC